MSPFIGVFECEKLREGMTETVRGGYRLAMRCRWDAKRSFEKRIPKRSLGTRLKTEFGNEVEKRVGTG